MQHVFLELYFLKINSLLYTRGAVLNTEFINLLDQRDCYAETDYSAPHGPALRESSEYETDAAAYTKLY